jgi:hypothetical protein
VPLAMKEPLRLEALLECAIVGTEAEQAYDDLVLLASQVWRTPGFPRTG